MFIYSAQMSYQSSRASFFHWQCFWSSKPRDSRFIVRDSIFIQMLLIFTEALYRDYIALCPTNSLHYVYLSEHVY